MSQRFMTIWIDLCQKDLKHLETRLDSILDLHLAHVYPTIETNKEAIRQFTAIVSEGCLPLIEALLTELEISYDIMEYHDPFIIRDFDEEPQYSLDELLNGNID